MNHYGLTVGQIAELVKSLASCSSMQGESEREGLVKGLSFSGQIERSNKPDQYVTNIVNTCANHTRGIEALVDGLWLVEKASQQVLTLLSLLDGVIRLSVSWQDMVELRALFALRSVPDGAAREAYCALVLSWQRIPADWAVNEFFLYALDHLAASSMTEEMVLFRYLLLCLPSMVNDVQVKVRAWMETIARREQISLDTLLARIAVASARPAAPAAPTEEGTFVLIELTPEGRPRSLEHGKYKVQAWLYRGTEPISVYTNDKACVLGKMSKIIAQILREPRVRAAEEAANGELTLEFLLPTGLLSYPVDAWEYEPKRPIGVWYRVVVRSRERAREKKDRNRIYRRWEYIRLDQTLHLNQAPRYAALSSPSENVLTLMNKHDVVCIALEFALPATPREREALLDDIVSIGIPIAIWPNCPPAEAACQQRLAAVLTANPLRILPQVAQDRRIANDRLTLLWDDPKRFPGDMEENFQLGAPGN